ncbi:MAG: carbon-nitrogen hydrolase family protein [Promethearchaeota archaeon]
MVEKQKDETLLEKAQLEENNYNWIEAAKLYEQILNYFLERNMIDKVAFAYKKLGFTNVMASEMADSPVDLSNRCKNAIDAYDKAIKLFNQIGSKEEELECMGDKLYAQIFISTSNEEIKNSLKDAFKIFLEASELYSQKGDNESKARTLSRALFCIGWVMNCLSEESEYDLLYYKYLDLIDKALKSAIEVKNVRDLGEVIYGIFLICFFQIYFKNFRKDDDFKNIMMNLRKKINDTIDLIGDSEDYRALSMIYYTYGQIYCGYACHFIKNEIEQIDMSIKGISILEKALNYARKANNNHLITASIFFIDWWAFFQRRLNYVQKRIYGDVNEMLKLSKMVGHNHYCFYALFLPVFYYANMSQRSFFTIRQRKSYAKQAIKYAKEALNLTSNLPYSAWPYQMLTYSYSELTRLSSLKDEQNKYSDKMFDYAQKAVEISKNYEGGLIRATGYSSMYRAYKTLADLTLNEENKINMLSSAAEAAKEYLEYTPESYTAELIGQIRLGLLLEDIGIISGKIDSLEQAKEIFYNLLNESTESGRYSYAAATSEYIARIEDRLGNNKSSAELYNKARVLYSESLKTIKYKPLKERSKEKIQYAEAWALIETAKLYHKEENHISAKDCYEKACQILGKLPRYNFEGSYYNAWIYLEEAEHLSKQAKHSDAIEKFVASSKYFTDALNELDTIIEKSKDKMEIDRINKLINVAKIRINYSNARADVENARILGKKGEHLTAGEKFSVAASQFKYICTKFELERERKELEAVYYLCKAWENMELAENSEDFQRYSNASSLFDKASNLFIENKLKMLSLGNSSFCQALELGCKFDATIKTEIKAEIYTKIKIILRKSATYYNKGGFESGAEWALATSIYFDASWHLIRADQEVDLEEKNKLLEIGSGFLKSAAELFAKAGYKNKERELLESLDMVLKEKKIILTALNTIIQPAITKSTVGIIAPACPIETSESPKLSEVSSYTQEYDSEEIKEVIKEKYKLIYKDLLKGHPEKQIDKIRVGVAQIGTSATGDILNEFYDEKPPGLLTLKDTKVNEIKSKIKEMVQKAYQANVNILLFPEMTVDLKYKQFLDDISNLAKKYEMYIIPGSYHNIEAKSNVSSIIGPEGILWQQEKHIPALISLEGRKFKEGINTSNLPRKTFVCNTKFGRIVIAICRDFLDMDLRVELKNFEPPIDLIFNPAFTPVTADFKAVHFDARRSIYAYTFFANVADYGDSLIYTPEKERTERVLPAKEVNIIYKDVDLFKLRSERKKWQKIKEAETRFIQSTR